MKPQPFANGAIGSDRAMGTTGVDLGRPGDPTDPSEEVSVPHRRGPAVVVRPGVRDADGMPTRAGPGVGGRDSGGRFAPGNPGGPGNPQARRSAALRRALLDAVTEDDVREVARKLVELAKGGDLAAIRELLGRVVGDAAAAELDERLGAMEERIRRITP